MSPTLQIDGSGYPPARIGFLNTSCPNDEILKSKNRNFIILIDFFFQD